MGKKKAKDGLFVQAGILAVASIIVKLISLVYRGPLTAIIGDEGNGYYNTAYNFYTIILIISSYSVPSAISKIMAGKLALGQYRNAQRIFQCALLYVCIVGTIGGGLLFFGADVLVSSNAAPVLRIFAPTIFIFGLLGVLRGYFQAYGSMLQTSVSQVLEQLLNAVVSIGAAHLLMQMAAGAGKTQTQQAIDGAIGSALGTGSGVLAALLFMVWMYQINRPGIRKQIRRDRHRQLEPYGEIMKETIRVVTPFILSSFILNLTTSLNQTIYIKTLVDGQGLDQVTVATQYGIFSGKAVVLTNIPISMATALASAIIPAISASYAKGNYEDTRRRYVNISWITMIIAVPCAVGMAVLSKPITMLLFPQKTSIDQASILLSLLAVTVVFYSVSTITNAVLQSIGRMNMPLVSAGIALAVQTLVLLLLLNFTDLGIYALALVSVLYSLMIFVCNELFIRKYLRPRMDIMKIYIMPILAAAFMGALSFGTYELLHLLLGLVGLGSDYFKNLIAMVPTLAVAVLSYAFFLVRSGAMTRSDLQSVPKGTVVIQVLTKLHWLPEERGFARQRSREEGVDLSVEQQIGARKILNRNADINDPYKEAEYRTGAYEETAYRQRGSYQENTSYYGDSSYQESAPYYENSSYRENAHYHRDSSYQEDAPYYGNPSYRVNTSHYGNTSKQESTSDYENPPYKEETYRGGARRQPAYQQASQEDYYFDEDDE